MAEIILDQTTLERLRKVQSTTILRDPEGKIIGHFLPALETGPDPDISEDELRRREQQGGGRKLKDILADLEKRS